MAGAEGSSTGSSSPPLAYAAYAPLHTAPSQSNSQQSSVALGSPPLILTGADPESDARRSAALKVFERAELSSATRNLRTRLAYASYKTTHNVPRLSLHDLEKQAPLGSAPGFTRTGPPKRKIGNNNYYNNPATQGGSLGPSAQRRPPYPNMGPPSNSLSSGGTARQDGENNASSVNGGSGASLFESILAPPPPKQARTILNAQDPPIPASVRPPLMQSSPRVIAPSSRSGGGKATARSIAEGTRGHAKSRKETVGTRASPGKHGHGHGKSASSAREVKGKRKQGGSASASGRSAANQDVDMEAAAALTSLLMQQRSNVPPLPGNASPRSHPHSHPHPPIDDDAVMHPYTAQSQFAQSSTRDGSDGGDVPDRTRTRSSTPRPAPTDNEAANLMLFLATSPSPSRKGSKTSALEREGSGSGGSGGPALPKGRILFPSASDPPPGTNVNVQQQQPRMIASPSRVAANPGLVRGEGGGGGGSWSSSVSSIGSEMGGGVRPTGHQRPGSGSAATGNGSSGVGLAPPPSFRPGPGSGQAPSSPQRRNSNDREREREPSFASTHDRSNLGPPPSSNVNAPPQFRVVGSGSGSSGGPGRGDAGPGSGAASGVGGGGSGNSGLRMDVGRKLYEEQRAAHAERGLGGAGESRIGHTHSHSPPAPASSGISS